jgi:hypothetical protein
MPSIVTVNVSLLQAPLPSTLQQSGALISQGATTTAQNTLTLLTEMSDLTAILTGGLAITSQTWTANVATTTTTAPHGIPNGDTVEVTIAGVTPAQYNGTFLATSTGASTFTYPLTSNPGGAATIQGVWTPDDVAELVAMATTFFAQGTAQSVYVLELGLDGVTEGVATLTTWLTNNPGILYGVLVPREWDGVSAFLTLIASYENTTAKFYFWVTTTTGTYTDYTAVMKCVYAGVEAPGIPSLEFTLAASFYRALAYRPSNTNKVAPFAFGFVFGVTPYPTRGNNTLLTTLKAASINYVGTGAEGGLTNTIQLWGTTKDGRDLTYWYSIDWMQINAQIALANEVINGANNPVNPLYYDQPGINRLQARLAGVVTNAITFGLATGTVTQTELDGPALDQALDAEAFVNQAVVNAIPFVPYATANPSDYRTGVYRGLTIIYIPARGFISIVLNIVASDFVTF